MNFLTRLLPHSAFRFDKDFRQNRRRLKRIAESDSRTFLRPKHWKFRLSNFRRAAQRFAAPRDSGNRNVLPPARRANERRNYSNRSAQRDALLRRNHGRDDDRRYADENFFDLLYRKVKRNKQQKQSNDWYYLRSGVKQSWSNNYKN